MLSMSMVGSLAKLEVFSENMRQVKATVESLEAFLEMPALPEPAQPVPTSGTGVELKNVHFSYSADGPEVLHGIDLALPQGSFTALVGPSGGGKSTVAKLIARFWDVTQGSITIGGVDVRQMPLAQLSGLVSFVTQDNYLFRCSLLENIRLGNPAATDEQVKAVARAAQCEELIAKLPQGYDTPAGEAGKRLSGGEKQRIAIARMLLKNAPILILDEATAFTDPENEDKIQQSIAALTRCKTLLVIAHRLSTEMSTTLIEYINGIEVIKAFNQGSKSYAKLTDKVRYNAQYYVNWMKKSQLGMAMAYGFFPAQMLTILPVGWLLWLHGSLTAETFLTVIVLALGMAAPIVAAFNFVDTLAQVGTTVGQVDEILNAEEQQHSVTPVTFAGHDIVLDHVSFDYHDDKEILHDVSLSIPAGRMTALVGPSGSGKSTIAKLAAGFWDVKTGSITLGGRDLKDIPLQQLYEQTAFVSQDNYLFDDTVRENIRMGRLNATDAEVEAAAHAAGCDSFIGELEHGYDTMVGVCGAHLSGGDKQRISIARAMLKDAPIVILDEATANVDPENEDRLQKAIEALTRDKTIIMIAHRLKTVCHADQILVVDHGRIVQQGTHEQLIGQPGIYAAFVGGRKQAEGWKL